MRRNAIFFRRIYLAVTLISCVLQPLTFATSTTKSPYTLKTVVIDPGHGGKDSGCSSPWKTKEKNVTLAIGLKLAEVLKRNQYKVYLTRTTDQFVSLPKRVQLANKYPPDQTLFISIHCNAHSDRRIHGIESYIFDLLPTDEHAATLAERENAEAQVDLIHFIESSLHKRGSEKFSWEAAKTTQSILVSKLNVKDRNVNAPDGAVKRAPFRVLADTKMPAILIELGFLSNRSEHGQLTSSKRQQQIAEAVALAVKKFDQQTHPQ